MKENSIKNERSSIEEDIKILETWLEELNELFNKTHINNTKERNALYNILSDYKRVLKENEELNNRCRNLDKEAQGYFEELAGDDTLSTRTMKQLQKENEELKEKENKIYKEIQESLAFEKFLIVKERKPDLFNQGRFYVSQIIYDILNDVQNPEGIHKENKCIQYIDYIPIQKVKDKIEKLDDESHAEGLEDIMNRKNYTITELVQYVLQELLEK